MQSLKCNYEAKILLPNDKGKRPMRLRTLVGKEWNVSLIIWLSDGCPLRRDVGNLCIRRECLCGSFIYESYG